MGLKNVSPSRIKTYDHCLFKYYLSYILKPKMKNNWGAAHGSLLHEILEDICADRGTDWMETLYKGYRGEKPTINRQGQPDIMESPLIWAKEKEYRDKRAYCVSCPYNIAEECKISGESIDDLSGCPKDLFMGSIEMMRDVIRRYDDIWPLILQDEKKFPVGIEYKFDIPIPNCETSFLGYADLVIERNPKTIEIIDYKTGKWTQNEEECRADIQVQGYAWAAYEEFVKDVNGHGYKYENVVLTFDYFVNKPVTVCFDQGSIAKTEKFLFDKVYQIDNTNVISRVIGDRYHDWKCKALCDVDICKKHWEGDFKLDEKI